MTNVEVEFGRLAMELMGTIRHTNMSKGNIICPKCGEKASVEAIEEDKYRFKAICSCGIRIEGTIFW